MKKLLGLITLFSVISFFSSVAMEENFYADAEQAAPRYLVEQMEQEARAERLRQFQEKERLDIERRRQEYRQKIRADQENKTTGEQTTGNKPTYVPVRQRLFY